MAGMTRVYIACSLDGFISGVNDDLLWLNEFQNEVVEDEDFIDPEALQYEQFIADVGVILMGRRTFDVVNAMDCDWPYQDQSVLVASHRALPASHSAVANSSGMLTQQAGSITELHARAREIAGDKDIYLDGGQLIRQGLEAGLVDDLILTMLPVALGAGVSLFSGLETPIQFETVGHYRLSQSMVQLHLRPKQL